MINLSDPGTKEQEEMSRKIRNEKLADQTKAGKAEAALRISEERYRRVSELTSDFAYAFKVEPDGDISSEWVTGALEKISGFSADELKERGGWEALIHPEDLQIPHAQLRALLAGRSKVVEYRIVTKEGKIKWMRDYGQPEWDETQKRVTHLYGAVQDITARREAEEALKESQETLLTVLDGIDATIYAADMETYEVLFMNQYMKDAFGSDFTGQICWKVFRGEKAPCAHCTNEKLLDDEGHPSGVCVWEDKNPLTGKWYINYDRAIKWIDGRFVRLQVATDISEIKRGQAKLQRQGEYLEALHDTSLGLIRRLDSEELLEAIMVRAANLVGAKGGFVCLYDPEKEDLVVKIAYGFSKGAVGVRFRSDEGLSGKVWRSGRLMVVDDYRSWEGRLQRTDLPYKDPRTTIGIPLKSGDKTVGVLGINYSERGVTFSEDEVSLLNRFAELASIALDNAHLYSSLQQELIQHKQTEAERHKLQQQLSQVEKMEAIGTLAGGIAHDFNNLLMGIQGRTSLMLMDRDETHPDFEHLKGIEDYVKRSAGLTRQLLGFARGGKYEIKVVDLNGVVKKSAEMFGRTKKEITIDIKSQKEIWMVEADVSQIEQVLLNLYVNAWQAMPGAGELYLATENITLDENFTRSYNTKPGRYVRITVTDTGSGIEEKIQKKIFDPFFTTKEIGRGTGLGLASAYGIIKNHDGIIDIESQIGQGTTFYIYLPASDPKVRNVKHSEHLEILRGDETVLLVDDEEMIIEVGREILETLGYRVVTARGGGEAIETYGRNPSGIDLVILDLIMPQMTGGEVFDRLKAMNSGLKIILSSGYSINGEVKGILERGCDGFVQKPFTIKALSKKLREVLEKEK